MPVFKRITLDSYSDGAIWEFTLTSLQKHLIIPLMDQQTNKQEKIFNVERGCNVQYK